jgi:hypothetical protein
MPQKRTIPRVCQQCGTDFLLSAGEHNRGGNKGKFCSRRCLRGGRGPVTVTCQRCASPFVVAAYRVPTAKFCSLACKDLGTPSPCIVSEDGQTAQITLFNRRGTVVAYVTIDASDMSLVAHHRWYLSDGYARRSDEINGWITSTRLHRDVLGLSPGDGLEVDHRDRDPLNCRRLNLRVIPHAGNVQNTSSRKGSTSAHRGVSWNTRQRKWIAQLQVDGQKHNLGAFDDELEAANVARAARARLLPFSVD